MDIPISLKMTLRDYQESIVYSSKSLELDLKSNPIFEFYESDYVFTVFNFDNKIVQLSYESYDDGKFISIQPGEEFCFSTGRDETGCYYPGYFCFRIIINNEITDCLFYVKPKNLELENVLDIRKYVDQFYYGLAQDMSKRRIASGGEKIEQHVPNASENLIFMNERLPMLLNYIDLYLKSDFTVTQKTNVITSSAKKIGNKSIKWLVKKGMTKNKNIYNPDRILVTKTEFNRDNSQNRMFKHELQFWNSEVKKVIQNLKKFIVSESRIINDANQSIEDLKTKVDAQEKVQKVARSVKIEDRERLKEYISDLDLRKKRLQDYQNDLENITHLKANIEYILYNTWIGSIRASSGSFGKVTDNRLKLMIGLKNEYLGIKKTSELDKANNRFEFGKKSTPKLFETFIYTLLLDMLIEDGFEIQNYNFETDDLATILSSQSMVRLKKDNLFCDVYYDKELKNSNEKFTGDEFVSVNSKHNRPDFIIAYYRNPDELINAYVVEVKWRAFNNIYNEVGNTDVVQNLIDYFNFAYHVESGKHKTRRGIINKVMVIYPDEKERITDIQKDEIIAIGMMPSFEIEASKSFAKLKAEIAISE